MRSDASATGSPRSGPPRRRRGEIVDASARIFHEKGYERASMQDVADAVGISAGSLYYYIDSKEDLLYEILKSAHDDVVAYMERIEKIDGNALQKIRAFVTLHITFNTENLAKMGVFLHEFRSIEPERRQIIVEARDFSDRLLRRLIGEAQREGLACPDIDAKLAALATLGMANWIYQWYRVDGPKRPAQVAEEFADFVVAALACTPATHRPGHRSQSAALPVEALSDLV